MITANAICQTAVEPIDETKVKKWKASVGTKNNKK